jgi:hypothetical protein
VHDSYNRRHHQKWPTWTTRVLGCHVSAKLISFCFVLFFILLHLPLAFTFVVSTLISTSLTRWWWWCHNFDVAVYFRPKRIEVHPPSANASCLSLKITCTLKFAMLVESKRSVPRRPLIDISGVRLLLHLIDIFEFGLVLRWCIVYFADFVLTTYYSTRLQVYFWSWVLYQMLQGSGQLIFQQPVGFTGVLATTMSLSGEYSPKPFCKGRAAVKWDNKLVVWGADVATAGSQNLADQ